MSHDAYQEFLHANSRRNYPFVEDASLMDDGGLFRLPNELLLNFRGFSRQEPDDSIVSLTALVGPSAASLPGPFQFDAQGWVMVFRIGTKNQDSGDPQYLRVVVDSGIPGDPSLLDTLVGFVPSLFGQSQPPGDMTNKGLTRNPTSGTDVVYDYLAAMIQVSVSPQAPGLMPFDSTARLYYSDALIEPGLFANTWRTEIERLVIEDQCWPEVDVTGDVVFREGYNVEIVRLDNSIQFSPERRAGQGVQSIVEFESWSCEGDPPPSGTEEERILALREPCRNNILRVNGVGPDAAYEFKILGDNGVTIQSFPNQHLIVINFRVPQPNVICPPLNEEGSSSSSSSGSSSG